MLVSDRYGSSFWKYSGNPSGGRQVDEILIAKLWQHGRRTAMRVNSDDHHFDWYAAFNASTTNVLFLRGMLANQMWYDTDDEYIFYHKVRTNRMKDADGRLLVSQIGMQSTHTGSTRLSYCSFLVYR